LLNHRFGPLDSLSRLALSLQGHLQAQVRQHDLVQALGQHHRDIIATCTTGITIAAAVAAGTFTLTTLTIAINRTAPTSQISVKL
jgi:pantothenate kinase